MNTSTLHIYDSNQYKVFTGPAQLEKDLNALYGIVQGIRADGQVNEQEIILLEEWLELVSPRASCSPYNTLVPFVDNVLADGIVTVEEASDIAWLCLQYLDKDKPYFDVITSSIQQLNGLLTGIAADRQINGQEINLLNNWLSGNHHLHKTWLFDSLTPLVKIAVENKILDKELHSSLLAICDSVNTNDSSSANSDNQLIQQLVTDSISISIPEFSFCITGASKRFSRKEIASIIELYGGYIQDTVSGKLHYLVVCDEKNTSWAFASYGRKIEKAMALKEKGKGPEVIYEDDLFSALEQLGYCH